MELGASGMTPRTLASWLAVFREIELRDRPGPERVGMRLRELVKEAKDG